jgi:2-polyprenyl-3-methyl-5-hydroxy-6-metoxy-1,4-benzoquinol methylase
VGECVGVPRRDPSGQQGTGLRHVANLEWNLRCKTCYTAGRQEILHLIPRSARHILDVGCAHGYLGRAVKEVQVCEIVGIELNENAAQEAAMYLDRVFCENVELFFPPHPPGYFDCIIMADILEHLVNPWKVLAQYVPYLAEEGVFVISLPNVRHYRVVGRLILGCWDYEESGILDNTHLRFFTLKSVRGLLDVARLEPRIIERIYRARPIARWINRLFLNRLEAFLVQQYVVQAGKRP